MAKKNLGLNCLAIGSLPHENVKEAMALVEKEFVQIPFLPQLANMNKSEDMIFQFLESMPGIVDNEEKIYFDSTSDEFFEELECFFLDYQNIFAEKNILKSKTLEKYSISQNNSAAFSEFTNLIAKSRPDYAKVQVVGPFTLATTLKDKEGKSAYYDETLREVIVKTLSLKILWQVAELKKAHSEVTPIIFIDEPSLSQLGTSAYVTVSAAQVSEILKELCDLINSQGCLSAIHCCGKCDWGQLIDSGVNIINLDAYFYAQNLSLFSDELKIFFEQGGYVAWGVVPTLDSKALASADLSQMLDKFEDAIGYLIKKGFDKKLILQQSLITPSCGAGSLSVSLAEKAMRLTNELSEKLKEIYKA